MAVYGIVGRRRRHWRSSRLRCQRFRDIDAPALHPAVFATAVMLLAVAVMPPGVVMTSTRWAKPLEASGTAGPY